MPLENGKTTKRILRRQQQVRAANGRGRQIPWHACGANHTDELPAVGKGPHGFERVLFLRTDHQWFAREARPFMMLFHALTRDEIAAQKVIVIRRAKLLVCVIASVRTNAEAVRVIEKHPSLCHAAAPMVPRNESQSDVIAVSARGLQQLGKIDEAVIFSQQRIVNDDAGTWTGIPPTLITKGEPQKDDGGNIFIGSQFKFFLRRQRSQHVEKYVPSIIF